MKDDGGSVVVDGDTVEELRQPQSVRARVLPLEREQPESVRSCLILNSNIHLSKTPCRWLAGSFGIIFPHKV